MTPAKCRWVQLNINGNVQNALFKMNSIQNPYQSLNASLVFTLMKSYWLRINQVNRVQMSVATKVIVLNVTKHVWLMIFLYVNLVTSNRLKYRKNLHLKTISSTLMTW